MWSSDLARRRALLALGVAALALPGCGFQRRQPLRLGFRSIALAGFSADSPLRAALVRQLATQVQLLPDPAQADVVLHALEDREDTTAVAQTAFAQVREVKLLRSFAFRATARDGSELLPPTRQELTRNLTYNETAALAKEAEMREIYRAMDTDIADQVLRRLAALLR